MRRRPCISREHRWEEEEVDELRVELRAAPVEECLARDLGRLRVAIAAAVRDRVEGVGDRDDARGERDAASLEAARIARPSQRSWCASTPSGRSG